MTVLGGHDPDPGENRRQGEIAQAAEQLVRHVQPGSSLEVSIKRKARYSMAAAPSLDEALGEWMDESPVHMVVSVAFCKFFPQYAITPVAKDLFWTLVGCLAERDDQGRYPHMMGSGEVSITQQALGKLIHVSRQTVSGGMTQLRERNFVWLAGRGVYQIHPAVLYFGSADKQREAIGYARGRRKDGKLPPLPMPGTVMQIITSSGVKRVVA